MSEAPRAEDTVEQDLGREFVLLLAGLVRGLAFYDRNNTAIVRLLDGMVALRAKLGDGEMKVQLLTDEFFVNGRLLKTDAQLWERCAALAAALNKISVGEVAIRHGLTREHLDTFAESLARAIRGKAGEFSVNSVGGVEVGKPLGRSIAAFRFEADRLAVATFCGMAELVERLYAENSQERTPSLLPLKRALQLVIDGMTTHGGHYLVLVAARDPKMTRSAVRIRVDAAIYAIGFGIACGFSKQELMTLGLGSVLAGLSESPDPDLAVEPLFRFAGLGDSALPLTLAVFDARALRQGKTAGLAGQILALSHAYVERTTGPKAIAPARFLKTLAAGEIKVVDARLGRAFAEWLGPYPLGSLAQLKSGAMAVVVRQTPGVNGKSRPIVALLTPGPTERVDLAARPGIEIAGTPTIEEAGINLAGF